MTLREAAIGVIKKGKTVYDIGFNRKDEIEFDADNLEDLEELWESFCKEHRLAADCVDYVEVGEADFEEE